MTAEPLTDSDVIALAYDLRNDRQFRERNAEYEEREALTYGERPVVIPGVDMPVAYHSSEIEDHGHKYKNRMLAAPIKIEVAAQQDAPRATERAQRQESFCYRHYYRWRDGRVFDGPLFDQATLGVGWCHLLLNKEVLPLVPDREDGEAPQDYLKRAGKALDDFAKGERSDLFLCESLHPGAVYWTPDRSHYLHAAEVPLDPIAKLYPDMPKISTTAGGTPIGESTAWSRTVPFLVVESADFIYHLLLDNDQGHVLGVYANPFGVPAFFPLVGEETRAADPLHAYRPLLAGKYSVVPTRNLLLTAMLGLGIRAPQERLTLVWMGQGPEPEVTGVQEIRVGEDGVLQPPPGYRIEGLDLRVSVDLPQALQALNAHDDYGFPKALAQPDEVSAASGYDRARAQDSVSSLLDPPLAHFGSMLVDTFRALLSAVKALDIPVTVRNLHPGQRMQPVPRTVAQQVTLDPADVVDVDIKVSFDSVTSFTRIAMQEEGLKLVAAGYMTETQMLSEVLGVDDVEQWRRQKVIDDSRRRAREKVVDDVDFILNQLRGVVAQEAMANAGLTPEDVPPPGGNGTMPAEQPGPTIPTGPGQAMPFQPPPPEMGGEVAGGIGAGGAAAGMGQ